MSEAPKIFAVELRDLINAAYDRGVHKEEIVYALATAEDPYQVALTKAAVEYQDAQKTTPAIVIGENAPPAEEPKGPAPDEVLPGAPIQTSAPKNNSVDIGDDMLLGSNVQPNDFTIKGGKVIQLGTVVAEAFKRTGSTVQEWNSLDQQSREDLITEVVKEMPLQDA